MTEKKSLKNWYLPIATALSTLGIAAYLECTEPVSTYTPKPQQLEQKLDLQPVKYQAVVSFGGTNFADLLDSLDGIGSALKAIKDEEKRVKNILSDPEKCPIYGIQDNLRKINGNDPFLRELVKIYSGRCNLESQIIEQMRPGDDKYFISLFEESFSNGDLNHDIRAADSALSKIEDMSYIQGLLDYYSKEDYGKGSFILSHYL